MSDTAQNILSRAYAQFIARGMVKKFIKSIVIEGDIAAATMEYLTERVSPNKVPNPTADIGLYAQRLAGASILSGNPTPETETSFETIRNEARDVTYENKLSDYVWSSIAGYTEAAVLIYNIFNDVDAVLCECRTAVDTNLGKSQTPMKISAFGWGALADATFAHVALQTLYTRTNLPNPNVNHLASAFGEEVSTFSDAWDDIRVRATEVLNALRAQDDYAGVGNPAMVALWLHTARNYMATIARANVSDIPEVMKTADQIAQTVFTLEKAHATQTEQDQDVITDLVAILKRFMVALYGVLQYQRTAQFDQTLVLALITEDDEVPAIVINGDLAHLIADPEQRQRLILGMSYYSKAISELPPYGITVDFFNTSLEYYVEKAKEQITVANLEEERNLFSRGRSLIVPILTKFINEFAARLPASKTMGNLDAYVNQVYGLMAVPKEDMSPHKRLVLIIAEMSGSDVIRNIMDKYYQNGLMRINEAMAQCFVDDLVDDYFIAQ